MSGFPILTLTTFLPLIGAAWIMLLRGEAEAVARNARWIALWTALVAFALSLVVWADACVEVYRELGDFVSQLQLRQPVLRYSTHA